MKNIIKNTLAATAVSLTTIIVLGVYGELLERRQVENNSKNFKMFNLKAERKES